jgi:CRP/FNR family transcriptional regulator
MTWNRNALRPIGRELLTDQQKAKLSDIGRIVRFKKGTQLHRKGDPANTILCMVDGAAKVYRNAEAEEHIVAFRFAGDFFGLAEAGSLVYSAMAVTDGAAYRLPVSALESQFLTDADFKFYFVRKLSQELYDAQHRAFLLTRRSAMARIALFFEFIESRQAISGGSLGQIHLPMSRADIAGYLGMSPEAVSRSFRILASRGIVQSVNRRLVKILDRDRLGALYSPQRGG